MTLECRVDFLVYASEDRNVVVKMRNAIVDELERKRCIRKNSHLKKPRTPARVGANINSPRLFFNDVISRAKFTRKIT